MAIEALTPSFNLDDDQEPEKLLIPFGAALVEYYDPTIVAGPDGSICGTTTWNGTPDGDNSSDKID